MLLALAVGTVFGTLAGYFGGRVDAVITLFVDLVLAFPLLILAILVVIVLGPTLWNVILAISISQLPILRSSRALARLLASPTGVRRVGDLPGLERSQGDTEARSPQRSTAHDGAGTTTIGLAILSAAALSFLGVGLQPPTPDWGRMVSELGVFVFTRPALPFYPGAAIAVTVVAANLLGGRSREARGPARAAGLVADDVLHRAARDPDSVVLFAVSVIIFFSLRFGPFNATALLEAGSSDPEKVAEIRQEWGLMIRCSFSTSTTSTRWSTAIWAARSATTLR